ncbi:MAG: TonB-dependent receptor [Bacteroidetes bacterium]|nr:TonB-dependent receptor [Bacteroidota bacterium]
MKIILSISLLSLCTLCFAQNIRVLNTENLPLANAHVQYHCIGQKSEDILLTDSSGKCTIPCQKAIVHISYVGYVSIDDTISTSAVFRMRLDTVSLTAIVITGQYSANNPEKAVHKVTIITKEKIALQGANNLQELLSNQNNVRLEQDNILGSSLNLQGVSGQNVKILIDGVSMVGRLGGNIDLSQINLQDVERIEIIEGPMSVNYGTDALAGTINIITKKGSKKPFHSSLNTYYESVGRYNINASMGFKKKSNYFSVEGGRNYFDGWSKVDTSRFKDWKPKEQYFASAQYVKQINRFELRLKSEWFDEKITNRGQRRQPSYTTAFDDYYYTTRYNNILSFEGKTKKDYQISILVGYNYYQRIKNSYFKNLVTLEQQLTTDPGDQDTSMFNLYMSRGSIAQVKKNKKINYQIGYDINIENTYGARIQGLNESIGDYAMFGSMEYSPKENITIRPAMRACYNTSYQAPLLPSINIKYKIKNVTFRASYARGFRSPGLKELYFNFVDINHNIQGNPYLKAENSNNYSFSTVWTKVHKSRIYKTEFSAFFNDISNLITLAQTNPQLASYTYVNIGKYKSVGGNLNFSCKIQHLTIDIGTSYIGRYNELSESNNTISTFSFSPELRSAIIYKIQKTKTTFSLFYKYNGKLNTYYLDDKSVLQQGTRGDYHTLDITVNQSLFKNKLVIGGGCKNLLNVTNIQYNGAPDAHSTNTGTSPAAWGRSFFVTLKFNINE